MVCDFKWDALGCHFDQIYNSISTAFKHPVTGENVFVVLDACHMLKLARNALASLGTMSLVPVTELLIELNGSSSTDFIWFKSKKG